MNSDRTGRIWLISAFLLLLIVPFAAADMDNVFMVLDTDDPGPVSPGDTFNIEFTVRNYDLDDLETVIAYIDPCPEGWECEEKTLAYELQGDHDENISITLPDRAFAKMYTAYVKLRSEWDVVRGDDRVLITVRGGGVSEVKTHAGLVETPAERVAETEPAAEPVVETLEDVVNDTDTTDVGYVLGVVEDVIPILDASEVKQNVERLQTSRQFREYATVVLVIIMVFIAIGAYASVRTVKKKRKK